jgi:SprB repeat/Secretion system C-terminal sorting domain/HYR domain
MKFSSAIAILTFISFAYSSSAQYYRTTVLGNSPKNLNKERVNVKLDTDPSWTTIFGTTTTPKWSTIQTLPFTFVFNGSPVNSYKVSSTGVLTFSTAATSVPGLTPSALPSASIPNNSICLWGLQPTDNWSFISHKTFGNPGNRQYWVTFSFCSTGTIELSTWSMVLEEGSNNIYLVDQWNGAGGTSALSVGIQINSSLAFSDPLSPSVTVTSGYDFTMADDLYHRFAPGVRPQKDIEVINFKMPYYVSTGNKTIEGTVHNVGTDPVTTLAVTWNDGSGPVSENLNVNIAPNSTYSFTCANQWNAQASPQASLTLAVTTTADANPSNNGYVKPVTVLASLPKKYVVVEERTGTWCGWCPRGAVGMGHLEQEPEFIGIAVHSGDPMEVQNYDFLIGTYMEGGGFPGAMFDRDNESNFNGGIGTLLTEFNTRRAYAAPCEVKNLAVNVNSSANEINISGETEWFGNIHGDYRLSCIIVEDDVIATTAGWFQANAYAGGSNGTQQFPSNVNNGFNFATAPNPANPTGFGGYDHVARYLSSGDLLGDPNSLPTGEVPMGTYSYTFAPIPASVVNNMTKAQAIVMVVDKYTGDIINAKKISLNCSVLPTVSIATPSTITCAQTSIQITASNSSQGANFSYQWIASNGGNIVGGGTTLMPTVNTSGTYTLRVTNNSTGCTNTSSTSVVGNNVPPSLNTNGGTLTCTTNTVTLNTSTNASNPIFAWTGPNGFTSNLQNPLVNANGNYNVSVTNPENGCTNTASVAVNSNTALPGASATGGILTCTTTAVTINGASTAPTVGYAWTGPNGFSSTLQSPMVNSNGSYSLIVTDTQNGCTSTAATTVALNNTQPNASASSSGNLNCNTSQLQMNGSGSSSGSVYNYLWTTTNGHFVSGETTLTPIVDVAGTYNLLVTNTENGCTNIASVGVSQSPPVTLSITGQTNITCNGVSNGNAIVAGSGGNGAFTYTWSNGGNAATISNVPAGSYFVTVSDGENCTSSASVNVTQPDVLNCNASATNQTSNGVNDGTATVAPSGGTSGYAYLWSNGGVTSTITGLAPGAYTVVVTDANGCTALQSVNVNAFNCAMQSQVEGVNISCFGTSNGSATVSLTGAADPVTYVWSNNATTQTINSLAAGVYTVNVLDANNCPATLNVSITEPTPLQANASSTNETGVGTNDGTATALPTGGTGSVTYLWSNAATAQTIVGLFSSTYTVTVSDANGCTSIQSVVVSPFNCAISMQPIVTNITCAGANNGSIVLSQTGGTAPFTYLWSNGSTSSSITNLPSGTYTASLTDANNCLISSSSTVTEPAPYSNWSSTTINPECPNQATGSATVSISGGTLPYTFTWNNGSTGNTISNVIAGTYSVRVSDGNGCLIDNTVLIQSNDIIPPTVSAQNATIGLNASGLATVTATALNVQTADNCAVAGTTFSPASFTCEQKGAQVVTVTVTDQAGLTASTTVTVTVVDNTAPILTCSGRIVACANNNTVNYTSPVATDNCPLFGGTWAQTSGLSSGSVFPIGVTNNTFTFTDAGGNMSSCSFEVEISTPVNFNNVSVTNASAGQNNGAIDISIAGGNAPYSFEWKKSDQVIIGTTEDISGLSIGFYTVIVKDANGCIFSKTDIEVKLSSSANEPVWLAGIRMMPNPTTGLTKIMFAEALTGALETQMMDATGRLVWSNISENQPVITIDASDLPSGIYLVRFRTAAESGTRKLVVNR